MGMLIGNGVLELEEETRRCGDFQLLKAMRLPWLWSEVAVNTAVNNTYLSNSRTFLPTCAKSRYGEWRGLALQN